jgi:MFS family permease
MLIREGKLFGRVHYAFVIMVCCCLLQAFGMGLILACGSLFYVPICEDLGFLRSEISTYMTGYFIGTTIATPIAGKLLTRFDMRIVISIAIILLSATVVAISRFSGLWEFQLAGLLVGLFGSFIFVLPAATLVGNWFVKRRGLFYGIVMACSGISTAIFSPIINGIIQTSGWRTGYLFMGILSLAVVLPCSLLLRGKPSELGISPWGYVVGEQSEEKLPVMRGVSVKRAIFSISFLCLFLFAGIASFSHGGIEQHLPGTIISFGFTASFGAMIVSAESVGSVLDKLLMGWLNDKVGVQNTTLIQLFIISLGLLGFLFIREPAVLLIAALLFGVQDSLMSVSVPLLIRELFGSKNYTQIHAWLRTGVGIFGAFSGVFVGGIYDATGQFTLAFVALLGFCVVAMALIKIAYWRRKCLNWEEKAQEHEINHAAPHTP